MSGRPRRTVEKKSYVEPKFKLPTQTVMTANRLTAKQRKQFEKVKGQFKTVDAWYQYRKSRAPKKAPRKILTAVQKRQNQMVPWLVCKLNGKNISIDLEPIIVKSFTQTFKAMWSSMDVKVLGALLMKQNNINKGFPRLYVGNSPPTISPTYSSKKNLQAFNNLNSVVTDSLSRQRLYLDNLNISKSGLLKFNRSGAEIAEVRQEILRSRGNTDKIIDLLSYKLIGDRLTVLTCKQVNEDQYGIIKPYDYEIGKLIVDSLYRGDDLRNPDALTNLSDALSVELRRSDNKLNILFEQAVMFTGDRPACLYSIIEKQPCILVLPPRKCMPTTRYYYINPTLLSLDKIKDPILKSIFNESDPDIQSMKVALLDSLHDFGKSETGLYDTLMDTNSGQFYKLFANNTKILEFLNIIQSFSVVNRTQGNIVNEIILTDKSVRVFEKNSDKDMDTMSDMFKNYAVIYDAGDYPVNLKNLRSKGLARILNAGSCQPNIIGSFNK